MALLLQFLLLSAGLFGLWKSAEYAVENAIGVSLSFGIERFSIGFFIFAISTGLPEISSSIISSVKDVPELSVGNLMGASLVNMTLILGVVLLMAKKIQVEGDLKIQLYKTIGLILLIFIGTAISPSDNYLTGILLIVIYIGAAVWFQVGIPKKEVSKEIEETEERVQQIEKKTTLPPRWDASLKFIASLIFLFFSSWVTIHACTQIAVLTNINLTIIGAVLIALGTTFPELSLEIQAIRKKEYDLAFGDIFGSSLLNVSLIMGLLTLLNPGLDLSFARKILPFILFTTFWVLQNFIRKKPLGRVDGIIFILVFVLYILWALFLETGTA